MLKNLKKVAAIVLSFAMAVQFGLADSYYVNAVEEPVEPQQEETTTTAPQEQEEVPTAEEAAPQQQEEEDAPAAEETNEQAAPETKSVELSYVAEDGTVLHETASRDFNLDYSLKTDSSVMLNFDGYTLKDVIINNSQTVPADQVNLSVTSDLVSVKFVYVSVNTKEDKQTSENNEQTKTEEASEDDAEADPETKEELPEYPAFDQSETAGNVVVHATAAEGVLPRDSKLVVKRITRKAILNAVEDTVSEKNKEMDSAVALDITIQNKDGVEIQPNGSVNISFENAAVSGDEINVYHVSDDASAVTEVATNTQSFDTNHFSIYVITGENEVPLTTFNFVANGESVSTQIVKTGDTLITPTAPDVAGKVFVGWYDGETKFEDFNTALTITETKTREITARYEDALYVYFYNPDGTQIMRTEKVGDHDPHGYTDVSYDVDSTHKLVGWAAQKNGTADIAKNIAVPKNQTSVNVYAIIKEGYWISFDSDGGSIIDSQFVLHGDKLVLDKSTTPTKPGYKFDGWYNGSTKVENGATVTNPMTLKAHWNAAEVNYTINYWQQKVTDDKNATDAQKTYEYVSAETKKATTGTKISATNSKTYKGFKYNENNSSKDVKISGDGTTIINVYYDRVLCTVNFYEYKQSGWSRSWQITKTVTGLYGASLPEGAWDTSTNAWYQYAYDGGDVSGLCVILTSFDFKTAGYADNTGNKSSNGIVTTCNFYGRKGKGSYNINYYNEQIDGSFKLVQTVSLSQSGLVIHEKYAGYELYKYSTDKNAGTDASYWVKQKDAREGREVDGTPVNVASKLKTYSLSYYNYNKVTKTEKNIKYTASLKSYANYTPARPSELPDYYVFGGWYKDKACTTKFDFNTEKMPNANVQIYAKWTAKKINLTYNLNTPDGTSKKVNRDVDAGTIASTVLPSASEIKGYSFAGWYVADGNGNITADAYNTNETITKDTSVIGKWLYNGRLTVVYDPGTEGTNAKVPTDSNIYAGGAKVTVAKNATTTSKKKFLGWKLKGNLYHPGDAFEVNKDLANDDNVITLKAIWGNEESSTTMSYNPGNGRGNVTTVPVKNNESVTLKSDKALGYQAPEKEGKEYYFAGWATSMDDANNGKATYAAGQTVHVDVNGENVLYATWIEKTVITLVANSNSVTYNGEAQSVEGFGDVADGYIVSDLTAKATGTNVGEYTTKIEGTAKVTKEGKDVTEKVVVNVVPGKLTISRRNVTLTSATDSKPYDGTALTNDKVTVGGQGFAEGQGATYKVTGSQTVVGHSANKFTYELKKGTNADNYNISKTEGTLEVTGLEDSKKHTAEVTAPSNEDTYDGTKKSAGTELTGTTFQWKDQTYTIEGLTSENVTKTDAGEYENKVNGTAKVLDAAGNDVTDQFKVTKNSGKLTIKKRTVTLTSATDSKPYDGTALTNDKVTVGGQGFAEGQGATYKVTGSQTVVGHSANKFTYELKKGTNADNYNISKTEGTLEVTGLEDSKKHTAEVTAPSNEDTYDGTKKSAGTELTGTTFQWKDQTYTIEGLTSENVTKTDAGEYENKVNGTAKVLDAAGNDVTDQFKVTKNSGKLTIKKRTVTLTSATDSKPYDGTALTNDKVTVGGQGFAEGQGATYKVTGSQTVVGHSANKFTYELKKGTNADNYNISKTEGTLEVTGLEDSKKHTAEVTAPSNEDTYDGTKKSAGTELTGTTFQWKDQTYTIEGLTSENVTKTDAGEYENKVNGTAKVLDAAGNDVTDQFKVTKNSGKLTIKKRTVTLTSATDSKPYDGTALTNDKVTVGGQGFAEGQGATYKVTGSQTVVGHSANKFTYELKKGTNADNYNISKTEGTLEVTGLEDSKKHTAEVTAPSNEDTYDGTKKSAGTELTGTTFQWKDQTYTIEGLTSENVTKTDAGEYENKVNGTAKVLDAAGNDVTDQFKVTKNSGKLTIKKRTVTLTSATDSKPYDGTALTNDKVTVGGQGFAEGQGATYKVTGSQTVVGHSANKFTYELKKGTNADNYNISKTEGTLEVTGLEDSKKHTAEVTAPSNEDTYDGTKKSAGTELTGTTFQWKDQTYTIEGLTSENVTKTDAGEYENKVNGTAKVLDAAGNDVTDQFKVTKNSGKLTIKKRTVTLTSATDSKPYDGTALTNDKVTVGGQGFAEGQGATYKVTGSQTVVGHSANKFTYELKKGTNADNYNISKTEGTLEVTGLEDSKKHTAEVTAPSNEDTYDGTKKSAGTELTGTTFQWKDQTYTIEGLTSENVTKTDAGEYENKVNGTAKVLDAAGNDVTDQFKVTKNSGKLTIKKRTVTLTSATDSKPYDGTALTNDKVTVGGQGFAEGQGATYKVTGSQTVVGHSANKFTYELKKGTNADNYNISKTEGTLEVTGLEDSKKHTAEVTAPSNEDTYDGTKKSAGTELTGTTFQWKDQTYTIEGLTSENVTKTDAGEYENKVNGTAKVLDAAGNDVTDQFKVTKNSGKLVINPKEYTVTTDSATKTYSGTALTAGGKVEGIVSDETVEFTTTGSQTEVGTSKNTYELVWKSAKATNYTLAKESIGTLKVKKQSIDPGTDPEKPNPDYTGAKVNSPSDEVYDGKEHKWIPTVTDKADKKLKAGTDYTVEYSTKNFKDVGTIKVTITGKGNYTGTVTRTYKITPKSVTVTANDKTKVFGETDPKLTATVDGTLGNDTVDYKLSRKTGEAVGKYEITVKGDKLQGNYSVTYVAGTLTITSQSIDPGTDPEKPNPDYTGAKVNSPSDAVYDGNEHKWIPTVTDKADKKLEAGTDYTVEYSTKNFKDVGTIKVTITGKGNYTGTVTRTYKITPKSVTVTANDKTKVFGETDPKLTATVDGTLGNDTVDYKLSRKTGEAVGKYEITVKGDKLQGNYSVTYVAGTLTITSQSIDPGTDPEKPNPDYTGAKVNSPSDAVYDGNEHKWIPTVTDKADKKLEAGTDYTVEYSTKNFKDVGTIKVTITGKGNYTGTVTRTYKVTPKEYTVTTDSATKTYSGTALTAGGKVEGIVSGEEVIITTTGSQTEVGTSKNTYELVWKSAKATNYTLAKESIGKLTVKAKSIVPDDKDTPESEKTGITVNEPSDSKYDGKEHKEVLTVTDTKTSKELVAGTDYSVTYSSDLVNAGTVTITVTGKGNYTGSFTKTYKITKRSVTLTSATVSKVYDGSALTNTSITVSGDGFVEGEGASYEVTGTQTEVGNSANAFEYKLNEKTLASNYNITKVVGTLTITAAPATVTPATPSTPSSTTSTTPRTPSAPQVTTPVETVEKETTPKAEPKKEEKVEEEYTPKASPQYYCALINLICAILTVLFGLLLLISKRHKSEDDDEEDDETKQQTNNDDEEKEQEKKRGLFTRVLAVLIAIVSVVFFLVTEDLSLPWTWTDQWTIWMVVIGLVQIVVFFVGRKWKNVDNDDDDEEAQQA